MPFEELVSCYCNRPRAVEEILCMSKRFLVFTTFIFSFITLTEAFQITKLFNSNNQLQAPTMSSEQTFIAIKPDGVMRGLVGEIIARFERRG